jgi:hypothetical protein
MHLKGTSLYLIMISLMFTKSAALARTNRFQPAVLGAFAVRCLAGSKGTADTVVETCTRKITELLNPIKIKVTSSNDDPNGSHVGDTTAPLLENFIDCGIVPTLSFADSGSLRIGGVRQQDNSSATKACIQGDLGGA